MDLRIAYLDEHLDAIPSLARWHHAEWHTRTPHLSVADRIAGFTARARRGSIPTGFVGPIVRQPAHVRRLDWSVVEEASYAGRSCTIMARRIAA